MVSIIVDDNLLLRSYQPSDAEELFACVNNSREHLRPWLPWVDMTTKPEHSLQYIQQSIVHQKNQEGIALGIVLDGKIIGGVGMHNWDHHLKKAQLGYWIAKDFEGKGILSECLKRFIDFLFVNVGLNKVEIHFMVSNKRSAALAERIGCKVEGIIRQNYILNGTYHDLVVTGLLKTEWTNLPPNSGKQFVPNF